MAINWGDAFQGALGGASTGAGIGSYSANPLGTALGAGVGGIGGFLASLFSGGGEKGGVKQAQNFSPEVQQILQLLMQQGQNGLQNPYEGWGDVENNARTQFQNNTVPGLAERFTSMGNNALSSGAFNSQLGQAGVGLESNLAALKQQYGQQNRNNALQQLSLGIQPSFTNYYQESQPGFGENLFAGVAQAAPKFLQGKQQSNQLDMILKALKGNGG